MEDLLKKKQELVDSGVQIYSYSRLGTFHTCLAEYKYNYIDRIKGKENIYTVLGTAVHGILEGIYNNTIDAKDFEQKYLEAYNKILQDGYDFPDEKIKENTMECIDSYIKYFDKDTRKSETEKYFLVEVNGKWIQGYIDRIAYNEDGTIDIIDYKISSKFGKKDIADKGRQLVLYAYALEQQGYKINKIYWDMLKYCNVTYNIDNRKRNPLTKRNEIWNNQTPLKKAMELAKLSEEKQLEILGELSTNNTCIVPSELKDYITIDKGYVEYEYNQENKDELIQYINDTINAIETTTEFPNTPITKGTSFYCGVLCGFREHCPAYQKYLDEINYTVDELQLTTKEISDFFA